MINKIHFDRDGCCFKADLPFTPTEGDVLIIEGVNKETQEKVTVVVELSWLVYNCIDGEWNIRSSIHDHMNAVKSEDNRDPMGEEV